MRLNIKIDFRNIYQIEWLSNELDYCKFRATTQHGELELYILIENKINPILPDIYNLAFGPLNQNGQINDQIRLKHLDNQKVYSTIIYVAYLFLSSNKEAHIGLDGSDIARSVLYFRILLTNYDYLEKIFDLTGIKYYVRLIRNFSKTSRFEIDSEDIINTVNKIVKNDKIERKKLYNYFVLKYNFESESFIFHK